MSLSHVRAAAGFLLVLCSLPLPAADWPQYRGDACRSGYTSEALPEKLQLAWKFQAAQGPVRAWPEEPRLAFDRAFQLVAAAGRVYFGSSADHCVYCLDGASGQIQWRFFTGAPVRFAPVVYKQLVIAASDDGFVYALEAGSGKLHWKRQVGASVEYVQGNGRMVARHPVRGGPVLRDEIVYVGAGIWPSEGIFVQALKAENGEVLWTNDSSGALTMPQPHSGSIADSGIACQGYLLATADTLLVPTGRAMPAALARNTGKFRYFHLQAFGKMGGSDCTATDFSFASAGMLCDLSSGAEIMRFYGTIVNTPELLLAGGKAYAQEIIRTTAQQRTQEAENRQATTLRRLKLDKPLLNEQWALEGASSAGITSIVAGRQFITACSDAKLQVCGLESKKIDATLKVEGIPCGLAVAAGRLYVSTDIGAIFCFTAPGQAATTLAQPAQSLAPNAATVALAKEILKNSGVSAGCCVDLGGDPELALELARQSALQVYVVESDPQKVQAAREKLDPKLYGTRVTVLQGDPTSSALPPYCADLVVSSRALLGTGALPEKEAARLQKPCGGVLISGRAEALQRHVRGPLPDSGNWTHLYANAGNTGCSDDKLVKAPFKTLWYTGADLLTPDRHGRGPAPLYMDGRLFMEGINALRAIDAYSGRILWEVALPGILKDYDQEHLMGVSETGSNFCLGPGRVYIVVAGVCRVLDAQTGKELARHYAPEDVKGTPGRWGYLSVVGDTLIGSVLDPDFVTRSPYKPADMSQMLRESTTLFALEAASGKQKWIYRAKHSIRHNCIAAGNERLYLIDRPLIEQDREKTPKPLPSMPRPPIPPGMLLALDLATGQELWRLPEDSGGTVLTYSSQADVLLVSGLMASFTLASNTSRHAVAHTGSTGKKLWEDAKAVSGHPLLIGKALYGYGTARQLLTGELLPLSFKRAHGCGVMSASCHTLFFRSGTLGFFDLVQGSKVQSIGGLRPSCWLNALPAGGLLLVADGTNRCVCSYLNRANLALVPAD